MMSSTLRRGFSDEIGSWKIIFIRVGVRRRVIARQGGSCPCPRTRTRPRFGRGNCMIALPVVDLPQPDSPTSPSVSPSFTSRLTPDTACTCSPVRPTGNSTTRSSTRRERLTLRPQRCVATPRHYRAPWLRGVRTPHQLIEAPASPRLRAAPAAWLRSNAWVPASVPTWKWHRNVWPARSGPKSGGSLRTHLSCAIRAPGRELAADRRVDEVGRSPADRLETRAARCASLGIDLSSASVYGWRRSENRTRVGRLLDDPPRVHDRDVVGAAGHNPEIVRDEHHRHEPFALLHLQQVENLRLHRDVERGRRFVGEQQAWGPHASAIAIITRWRMPPDSWCGYSSQPPFGLRNPDRLQQRSAVSSA